MFTPGAVCQAATSRSGCGNGSGFSSMLLIMLKIAVFAPMPNARVTTVVMVKIGVRARRRTVCLKSWMRSYKGDTPKRAITCLALK